MIKVLVIDDSDIDLSIMFNRLSKEISINAFYLSDSEHSLKVVKKFKPDVILLDMFMPKLSGIDVLKLLSQDDETKDIPVIFLTSDDTVEEKCRQLNLKVSNVFHKPVNLNDVVDTIKDTRLVKMIEQISEDIKHIRGEP